jgi:pancreatic triacylglycerol lipase
LDFTNIVIFSGTHYKIMMKISDSEESLIHGGEIGLMSIIIEGHSKKTSEKIVFSSMEPM